MSTNGKIKRHSGIVRFIHWSVAVSTFLLIISGLFQLPLAKRYFVDQLPALSWSSDYGVTVALHYIAAIWLTFVAVFHVVYHGLRREFNILPRRGDFKESLQIIKSMFGMGEEPPSHKYLAEQRLAYAFIAFSLLLVIVTGYIKVLKNLPAVSMADGTLNLVTNLHNLGMGLVIIGIIAHLAAFVIPTNWPLLPSMFTGYVAKDYVSHRHPLWQQDLKEKKKVSGLFQGGLGLEKTVRLVAGSFIFIGLVIDALWWLPFLVAAMLLISALTGFCPAETLLRKLDKQQNESIKF